MRPELQIKAVPATDWQGEEDRTNRRYGINSEVSDVTVSGPGLTKEDVLPHWQWPYDLNECIEIKRRPARFNLTLTLDLKAPSHHASVQVSDPTGIARETACLKKAAEQVHLLGLPAGVDSQRIVVSLTFKKKREP